MKCVIFDIDGTLIDEAHRLEVQTDSVAKWFGDSSEEKQSVIDEFFAVNDRAQVLKNQGQPQFKNNIPWYMQEIGHKLGVNVSEEEAKIMAEKWSSAYDDSHENPQLFPDVVDVLQALREKGVEMLVASGNTEKTRKIILSQTGIEDYFEAIYTAIDIGFQKQDVRFWQVVLREINYAPGEIVVVGNQINDDVVHPQSLGLTTVLVNRPGVLRKNLGSKDVAPDYTINDLQRLVEIVG